jgi:hypothetical protein
MLELFQAGGFSMFGVVGFGLAALVAAFLFAWHPRRERVGFVVGLGTATLFMSLGGTSMAMAKVASVVAQGVSSAKFDRETGTLILIQGFSETMSPLIFGFTLLSLTAFVGALGWRRLHRTAA